jgi:hypothetical protein
VRSIANGEAQLSPHPFTNPEGDENLYSRVGELPELGLVGSLRVSRTGAAGSRERYSESSCSPTANLDSHQVRLEFEPNDVLTLNLIYYKFLPYNDNQDFGVTPSRVSSSSLADEVDTILDVSLANWWTMTATFAFAVPNEGIREAVNGSSTGLSGILYTKRTSTSDGRRRGESQSCRALPPGARGYFLTFMLTPAAANDHFNPWVVDTRLTVTPFWFFIMAAEAPPATVAPADAAV